MGTVAEIKEKTWAIQPPPAWTPPAFTVPPLPARALALDPDPAMPTLPQCVGLLLLDTAAHRAVLINSRGRREFAISATSKKRLRHLYEWRRYAVLDVSLVRELEGVAA